MRLAAAVLLSRGSEVWLGRRGRTRFLPGFWVFPGGGVDAGESPRETASRELVEEAGLLLPEARLTPFARAVTPPYSPYRFDAYIYRSQLDPSEHLTCDGVELLEGRWDTVEGWLEEHRSGSVQLAPPTYRQLRLWHRCIRGLQPWPTPEEAFAEPPIQHRRVLPFGPEVTVVPGRTPGLAPGHWTNTVVLGRRRLVLVDPAGESPDVLLAELERRSEQGDELCAVVLSHHHPDHLSGYLSARLQGLPLYCHPLTAELLPKGFPTPRLLYDQQPLSFEEGTTIRAHFTPGHAPGHLTFELPRQRTLLAGDLISSLSSIVIPSDNGDLNAYLDSLQRMRERDCHLVIPSHGPPFGRGSDPFGQALAHRRKREAQIETLLQQRSWGLEQLTAHLYRGLQPELLAAARANVGHHLKRLEQRGVALREGSDEWRIA